MPEIDTELFQQITLGGLGLLLIILLLVLNSLSKMKSALKEGVREPPAQVMGEQLHDHQPAASATPARGYTEPWGEVATQPQPTVTQSFEAPGLSASPAAEPLPEEQPFERDGRWWFKRGSEILVYDEQTGQWQPAPSDNPFAGSGGAAAPAFASSTTMSGSGEGFWKCPSCGAVNGSTSATCRMCFSARP